MNRPRDYCEVAKNTNFSTAGLILLYIMAESKPSFTLPPIKDNSIGWGPASDVLPEQFRDIPYAPYSKGDKLGRIADWSAPETQKQDNREVSGRTGRQGFNRFNKGVFL
jgi:translation initiation factor 3 subunit D